MGIDFDSRELRKWVGGWPYQTAENKSNQLLGGIKECLPGWTVLHCRTMSKYGCHYTKDRSTGQTRSKCKLQRRNIDPPAALRTGICSRRRQDASEEGHGQWYFVLPERTDLVDITFRRPGRSFGFSAAVFTSYNPLTATLRWRIPSRMYIRTASIG